MHLQKFYQIQMLNFFICNLNTAAKRRYKKLKKNNHIMRLNQL